MSVYTSVMLLGLHVIHGVLGTLPLPTYTQNQVKDSAGDLEHRQFTVLPLGTDLNPFAPLARDLKPKKLLRRLGDDYNPFWMSLQLPADMLHTHVRGRGQPAAGPDLDSVNLTMLDHALLAKYGQEFASRDMARGILGLVRSWLLVKASCPVYYLWEDLGRLFWPRWVRRSFCSLQDSPLLNMNSRPASRVPASDCSWPPGMHCVPARTKQLRILLWQCRQKAHGMTGSPSSLNTSRPHTSGTSGSQRTNRSWYLQMQKANAQRVSFHSDKTSSLTRGRGNVLTGHQHILSADNETQSNMLLKANGSHAPGTDRQHRKVVVHRHHDFNRINNKHCTKRQEEGAETENWSSRAWRERRGGSNPQCRWVKVPYPVTDDCVCSC